MGVSDPSGPCSRFLAGSLWPHERELPSLPLVAVLWESFRGSVNSNKLFLPVGRPTFLHDLYCTQFLSLPNMPPPHHSKTVQMHLTSIPPPQSPTASHPERLQPAQS